MWDHKVIIWDKHLSREPNVIIRSKFYYVCNATIWNNRYHVLLVQIKYVQWAYGTYNLGANVIIWMQMPWQLYAYSWVGEGGGLRGLSQWVQLCTWSPNKLWRSNSIYNLYVRFHRHPLYLLTSLSKFNGKSKSLYIQIEDTRWARMMRKSPGLLFSSLSFLLQFLL